MNRTLVIASCAALLAAHTDVESESKLGWEAGVGTRAFSLANNATATARDLSAMYWNPGAMGFIPVREFQFALDGTSLSGSYELGGSTGPAAPILRPRISQAGILLAVPTSRGGLSFGAAFQNVTLFDDLFEYHLDSTWQGDPWVVDDVYRNSGGLRLISGAAGFQIARGMGLGVALSLLAGREEGLEDYRAEVAGTPYDEKSFQLRRRFVGYDLRIGYLAEIAGRVRIGARLALPRIAGFTETQDSLDQASGAVQSSHEYSGTLYSSYTGAVGVALTLPFMTATAEVRGRAPYSMVFVLENIPDSSSARYSRLEAGAGVEIPLVVVPVAVRAGYSWAETDLHPYLLSYDNERIDWSDGGLRADGPRHLISAGIGYVARNVSLDAAYGVSLWDLVLPDFLGHIDERQTYVQHRVVASFAVRF